MEIRRARHVLSLADAQNDLKHSYWVDTGFACGLVEVAGDRIIDTAPIFTRWRGQSWAKFKHYYKAKVQEIPT